MTDTHTNPPLLGYADRLSAKQGDTVAFKVSSKTGTPFNARLVRSISADPNPAGQGIVEEDASHYFESQSFPSVERLFNSGSYAIAQTELNAAPGASLTFSATIFPTRHSDCVQSIITVGSFDLYLNTAGQLCLSAEGQSVSTSMALELRNWYQVSAQIVNGVVTLEQRQLGRTQSATVEARGEINPQIALSGTPLIAARLVDGLAIQHFNGKIEAPSIQENGEIIAAWDFSQGISTTIGSATKGPDLTLVNFPARAVTGANWDASEMNWTHKPEHYAAIHFHDDDIYDFEWDTDFTFIVPSGMPSGAYVMRLESEGHEDAIPFFICMASGQRTADLCVLVSTFTYAIYGNHARPDYAPSWQERLSEWNAYPYNPAEFPQYGLSTYNYHSDGSGICHASHHRPLFNLRPGYVTFGAASCSGLRHFQADSHLLSWLHAKGIEYDLVTDYELHNEGVAAISGYKAVTTGSHPEYHTNETLDALRDYRDNGGNLMYLGGNGFYWRIAVHAENDSVLEIRRAEDGIRAWAAEPGEYYNAFDGTYGGLWRRNGRPPQDLVGIGFAAQGEFFGDPFLRISHEAKYDWVFEGIEEDIIGDFGFSGNGAAGFELDHIDHRLGTPYTTVVLARSVTRENGFMLVPEEQLTHLTNLTGGTEKEAMHADMIWTDYPGGGSVFTTGSITFCGSLPWNDFDNNVSTLLFNVMQKHLA
ncbi:N,N-dimethylformamidase beta subunit family domain-containing protein [Granulosicoccus antarcticus]|uniref:N,N-dimethylformamidase beta subunit n=1 Tax=Granulosicoccus antarcticus IMCC3135 TaxID=1192854 RepID=A0A2Z2P2Z3_9GAMM|nr:N,N-dimethylformamidase beta subunit family domain-containing protein [Granulosicoccus antarcticus]ASJ76718.1 N,N-dimethylformamidase beta subunit [Granulosicoccus antarcticus IMCC3135]